MDGGRFIEVASDEAALLLAAAGERPRASIAEGGAGEADAVPFALRHAVGDDEASGLVPHANNVVILGWIDHLADRHGAAAGAPRAVLAATGRMWFVARHELDYLGESFVGDELAMVAWITRLGRTSLERASRIYRLERDGAPRLVVRATSRWALVDLASRRPATIPEDVRRRLRSGGGPAA